EADLRVLDARGDQTQAFFRLHAEGESGAVLLLGEATEARVRDGLVSRAEHPANAGGRDERSSIGPYAKRKGLVAVRALLGPLGVWHEQGRLRDHAHPDGARVAIGEKGVLVDGRMIAQVAIADVPRRGRHEVVRIVE